MQETAQTRTAKLIADLWRKNQPQILERIAALQKTSESAAAGTLTAEERTEAESLAHKLAGSLGMFGYPEGTRIARDLEDELHQESPDPTLLQSLVRDLSATLFPADAVGNASGN